VIFIGTATRLSAARREQRFAAMRLVGATPRQVSVIAAVESAAAAVAGVAIGFGLFFVLRIPLAAIPFTGQSFFPAEMSLTVPDILAVAIGVPAAAAVTARLALRRVNISPLGVTRRVTPAPLRAWRVSASSWPRSRCSGASPARRPPEASDDQLKFTWALPDRHPASATLGSCSEDLRTHTTVSPPRWTARSRSWPCSGSRSWSSRS
jgi:hypothetical protein